MQPSSRQGVVQNVAVGASAAASAALGSLTRQVRLCATTACYYLVTEGSEGTTVTVTASNGSYLPANVAPEYVTVTGGQKIEVIQASAGGVLSITEME